MRKTWPWHCLAICWLIVFLLYCRALIGVSGHRIGTLGACILAFELLFIGLQFVLQASWQREWDQMGDSTGARSAMQSEGSRFYYRLGLAQLFCSLIYLDISTFGFLFDLEMFATLVFGIAVAHGLLRSARRLAPIPDEIQRDARKMADLGLPHQATPEEMTRIAIIVMGPGVAFTVVLCLYITYGSSDILSNRTPWWLGIPTLIALALTLLRRIKISQL
jgi:hypothetical protein